jgi:hypothetical protein
VENGGWGGATTFPAPLRKAALLRRLAGGNLKDAIALMLEPVDVSELPGAERHLVRETPLL